MRDSFKSEDKQFWLLSLICIFVLASISVYVNSFTCFHLSTDSSGATSSENQTASKPRSPARGYTTTRHYYCSHNTAGHILSTHPPPWCIQDAQCWINQLYLEYILLNNTVNCQIRHHYVRLCAVLNSFRLFWLWKKRRGAGTICNRFSKII